MMVCDMNLAPAVVLHYVKRIQSRVKARLMILTLKLNDSTVEAAMPEMLADLQEWAPKPVRATQLPANRAEFCVIAGKL